jgi:hypothetical protein
MPPPMPIPAAKLMGIISHLPHSFFLAVLIPRIFFGVQSFLTIEAKLFPMCLLNFISFYSTCADMLLCLRSEISSALDHTFCSPRLRAHLEWSILPDLHSSDHHPVNLHISATAPVVSRHLNWIIKCAACDTFS